MDEQTSVALIQALSAIWTSIRAHHPDVPGVVLLPAPAPSGRMNVLGHFAALRWSPREEGGQLMHEVVVIAEHLKRGAEDVLETLLHEAAHAMNFARGIHDCSASQYHNGRFKEAAQELGLAVERARHYGFALTSLTKSTRDRYERETVELDNVLVQRRTFGQRRPTPGGNGGVTTKEDDKPSRARSRKAVCACNFIIRVSRKTLAETTIRCDSCGEPFRFT